MAGEKPSARSLRGRPRRRSRGVDPRDVRAPRGLAEDDAQGGLGGHRVADGVRRTRRVDHRARDLGRGVLPGARAGAAGHGTQPRRAHDHPLGHRRAEAPVPAEDPQRATRSGPRASPSRAPAPTWPACARARKIAAITTWSMARRCGRPARSTPTRSSCSSAPIRAAQAQGHQLSARRPEVAGGERAAAGAGHRPSPFQRGLLHRRAGAQDQAARSDQPGLEGLDDHAHVRAPFVRRAESHRAGAAVSLRPRAGCRSTAGRRGTIRGSASACRSSTSTARR